MYNSFRIYVYGLVDHYFWDKIIIEIYLYIYFIIQLFGVNKMLKKITFFNKMLKKITFFSKMLKKNTFLKIFNHVFYTKSYSRKSPENRTPVLWRYNRSLLPPLSYQARFQMHRVN